MTPCRLVYTDINVSEEATVSIISSREQQPCGQLSKLGAQTMAERSQKEAAIHRQNIMYHPLTTPPTLPPSTLAFPLPHPLLFYQDDRDRRLLYNVITNLPILTASHPKYQLLCSATPRHSNTMLSIYCDVTFSHLISSKSQEALLKV
jgi:hypothetical protein